MPNTGGSLSISSESSSSQSKVLAGALEIARLLALGAAAVAVHLWLKNRLGLPPGHQGTVWIALMVTARITSTMRWASTTSAIGASATAIGAAAGFGDPFRWLPYLVAGAIVDFGCMVFRRWRDRAWLLVPLAGVAHAAKPLVRVAITAGSGWHYESLMTGVAYPAATHLAFGVLGALAALGGRRALRR